MALAPLLAYIRIAKILENATDYSLQSTVRRALFLPTSREAKYKALHAVETFFWRGGDALAGLATFVIVGLLGLAVRNFAAFNIVLIVVWVLLAAGITREHRKLTAEAPAKAA
jgi:AAA family ATP:ADP antiporter